MEKIITLLLPAILSIMLISASAERTFSQSSNMTLLSNWDDPNLPSSNGLTYNDIWGYAAPDGKEYAIMGSRGFTIFIDISDPANPVEVTRIAGANNASTWRDFKTYGQYAYGVADVSPASLQIFDLQNLPNSVTKVYDLTTPASPVNLGSISSYPGQGLNHSSWLSGDGKVLVMADETHSSPLKVLDVTDLSDIEVMSTFKSTLLAPAHTNSIAHNPFIIGDYAVISYYHEGVQVYDISDPSNPVNAAYYDTEPSNTDYSGFAGCWGVYPYLPSGNIIASDIENGLFVLQTSFPLNSCPVEQTVSGTFTSGTHTFRASSKIISDAIVGSSVDFHLIAGSLITLSPGFHSQNGSESVIMIGDCDTPVPKSQIVVNTNNTVSHSANANPVARKSSSTAGAIRAETEKSFFRLGKTEVNIYPNPFSAITTIHYSLSEASVVNIVIRDGLGQVVFMPVTNEQQPAGEYKLPFDGSTFTSGIYYCNLNARGQNLVQKIILVH